MTNNLIQIDENVVAEKVVNFILAGVVTCAQAANCSAFVRGIVVDMHSRILAPPGVHPVDKVFECGFLLLAGVSPSVTKLELIG